LECYQTKKDLESFPGSFSPDINGILKLLEGLFLLKIFHLCVDITDKDAVVVEGKEEHKLLGTNCKEPSG